MIYMVLFELWYLIAGKTFLRYIFRMAGHKEGSPQPSTSGVVKEK